MKCPKFVAAMLASGMGIDPVEAECDKEECAWWSSEMKQCDSTGLLPYARDLENALLLIAGKMPYEGQFRT